MVDTKVMTLPMDEQQWGILGVKQEGESLYSIISLLEGEILSFIEGKNAVALIHIVDQFGLPEPIVLLSIGGLIREGLVVARRHNNFLFLTTRV